MWTYIYQAFEKWYVWSQGENYDANHKKQKKLKTKLRKKNLVFPNKKSLYFSIEERSNRKERSQKK